MLNQHDLAKLLHDTCERLTSDDNFLPRPFVPDSPSGRLLIAACEDILFRFSLVAWPNVGTVCLFEKLSAAEKAGALVFEVPF